MRRDVYKGLGNLLVACCLAPLVQIPLDALFIVNC